MLEALVVEPFFARLVRAAEQGLIRIRRLLALADDLDGLRCGVSRQYAGHGGQ